MEFGIWILDFVFPSLPCEYFLYLGSQTDPDYLMKIPKTYLLLSLLLLPLLSCNRLASENPESFPAMPAKENDFQVIAYYTPSTREIDSATVQQLDQIIYSFLHLKGNRLHLEADRDVKSLAYLVSLKKQNPDLKVLVSLGGWGGCETCSDVFSHPESRKEFAISVKEIMEQQQADGIDLDWEYPAISGYPGHAYKPEDRENFTSLVEVLRETLGNEAIISFAAGGSNRFLENSVEWKKVMPLVDGVNLMSYDLVSGGSDSTGHHTPLYSTPAQRSSAVNAIEFLDSLGIPMEKIVVGAAFYARIWEEVDSTSRGLYQPGKFKEAMLFRDLELCFEDNPGFIRYWDSTANAAYSFHPEKGLFATYDDSLSIARKTEYVRDNGLGGIMFWQLSGDSPGEGLLDVIYGVKTSSK